ncbi:MAG: PhnD/SsuA/transferrin family substrate-binding protein [Ignavibacteria bacterium]|nr:PhnD/SsuA/transferrin family substrate-binding protein [Ignavibacteria bacterium]
MKIKIIYTLTAFVLLLSLSSFCQVKPEIKTKVVRLGGLPGLIEGVKIEDAEAAFKILTDSFVKGLKQKKGLNFDFTGKMYKNVSSLIEELNSKKINYFYVSFIDYFKINNKGEYIPFLKGSRDGTDKFTNYILITNSGNQENQILNLHNTKISIPNSDDINMGIYWIKTKLREELGEKEFKTIDFQQAQQNESKLTLSVFFGKTDYALVTLHTYNLIAELNPSIKSKIQILAQSKPLATGIFAYRKGEEPETVKAVRDVALEIHQDLQGKQILNLFKSERLFEIFPADLKESEIIINKYNQFFKQ